MGTFLNIWLILHGIVMGLVINNLMSIGSKREFCAFNEIATIVIIFTLAIELVTLSFVVVDIGIYRFVV